MCAQLMLGGEGRARGNDGCGYALAENAIRDGEYQGARDLGMGLKGSFHLGGGNFLAAAIDAVVHPARHSKTSLLIQLTKIAGAIPVIDGGLVTLLQAFEDGVDKPAAGGDFAKHSRGRRLAIVIKAGQRPWGQGAAHAAVALSKLSGWRARQHWGRPR